MVAASVQSPLVSVSVEPMPSVPPERFSVPTVPAPPRVRLPPLWVRVVMPRVPAAVAVPLAMARGPVNTLPSAKP